MDLDNLSTYEKRVCLLNVAVNRFECKGYSAVLWNLGERLGVTVDIQDDFAVVHSWQITPESTASEVADVIAQLEFLALDSPVVKVS